MKKMLLLAMAAVMFMACENGGGNSGMSGKDKTAVSASTSKVAKMIGNDRTKVEKSFTDAGFVKVDPSVSLPALAPKKAPAVKKDGTVTLTYAYGVSDIADEKELIQALKEGRCVIMLEAMFHGDIFTGSSVMFIVGKNEENKTTINNTFLYTSNEMYKALPSAPMFSWEGKIADSAAEIDAGGKEYDSHSEFASKINASQEIAAVEAASGITDMNYITGEYEGFGYYLAWINPSDEEFYKSDFSYFGTPVAVGEYMVVDINAMSNLY